MNLRLGKFNPYSIPDNSKILVISKRGFGRSVLFKDLLWHKRHLPTANIVNYNEDFESVYSSLIPSVTIDTSLDEELLENLPKEGALVFDNCFDDVLFEMTVLDSNVLTMIGFLPNYLPQSLEGIDYLFIFELPSHWHNTVYRHLETIFPTIELFSQILEQTTGNYECLVANLSSKSQKFENRLFWYKASIHPIFQMGTCVPTPALVPNPAPVQETSGISDFELYSIINDFLETEQAQANYYWEPSPSEILIQRQAVERMGRKARSEHMSWVRSHRKGRR